MKFTNKNDPSPGTRVRFTDGPFACLERPEGVLERKVTVPDVTHPYEVRVAHPVEGEPDATMLIPCARWEFTEI